MTHTAKTKAFPYARTIRYLILALGALIMILPMIYMLTSSLRPNSMTFSYPPKIIPAVGEVTLQNYDYVLLRQNFTGYLTNTLLVALGDNPADCAGSLDAGILYCPAAFHRPQIPLWHDHHNDDDTRSGHDSSAV